MDNVTKLEQLINPEVMADIVSAKVDKKMRTLKYAKVDTTLQGQAGDTITVPKFTFIGEAVDVAEGEEIPVRQMGTSTESYKIKKAGIGGTLTDEAVLSGYGNPVGELNNQMALSIAGKCDTDNMAEFYKATTTFTANDAISYNNIVLAIDAFGEEENSEKVMFVHPKQVTQLRLDPNFISKEKYGNQVMVDGEIGIIGNAHIVPSKKVKLEEGFYFNPIVKLEEDTETEDVSPALTIFLKRDTNVETDRISKRRLTEVTGDKMYISALTNESKVVIAKMKETATV